MKIIKVDKQAVNTVVDILKSGGLVIMPTETLYGAMVDATDVPAVNKLATYKNRPLGKPYSIAVTDQEMAEKYVQLNEAAKNIYKAFLPGPVTVVSKGRHQVAPGVESEMGTLGVRIPDYPLVINVIKKLRHPITATSANASYQKRPYKISDILENLSRKQKLLIDLIVDAGELEHNEPSTVIDTTYDNVVVLRQGDVYLKNGNEVFSQSEENTKNVAKELWQKYLQYHNKRAIVFALEGPMGVGKTQFAKGIALAMGIKVNVVSPSYSLEEIYNHSLVHIDAWRMETDQELQNLGFSQRITDKSVVVIEWADRVADIIRAYNEEAIVVWVKIRYAKKTNERLISWGNI